MFWKKKTPPFSIVNPGEAAEKRQAFRYSFSKEQKFPMEFLGRQVMLRDLSAGGMSFQNNNFSVEDQDLVSLDLDVPCMDFYARISAELRITGIDEQGICYARFQNSDDTITELIHQFLLEMQKQDLRLKKYTSE